MATVYKIEMEVVSDYVDWSPRQVKDYIKNKLDVSKNERITSIKVKRKH